MGVTGYRPLSKPFREPRRRDDHRLRVRLKARPKNVSARRPSISSKISRHQSATVVKMI